MVDKVTVGQILSDYFGLLCQFSFYQPFHFISHLSLTLYSPDTDNVTNETNLS